MSNKKHSGMNQSLQGLAWKVTAIPEIMKQVKVLTISSELRNSISALKHDEYKEPAVRSLYNVLPVLAPEILHFFPRTFTDTPSYPYWLAAEVGEQIHLEKLIQAMKAWAIACYGAGSTQAVGANRWSPKDLAWKTISLSESPIDIQLRLLPSLLSRHMVRSQEFEFILKDVNGGEAFSSRMLVGITPKYDTAELMTWPPSKYREDGREDYYSYYLRLRMTFMPGSSDLFILSRSGVRRWYSQPVINRDFIKFKRNRGKSVYLLQQNSWLTESDSPPFLIPISLKRLGQNFYFLGNQPKVIEALSFGSLPSADDYISNLPAHFSQMAMVYDDVVFQENHLVGKGIEAADHYDAFETLNSIMPAGFTTLTTWENVRGEYEYQKYQRTSDNYAAKDHKNTPSNVKRDALDHIAEPIRIEIHAAEPARVKVTILQSLGLESHAIDFQNEVLKIPLNADGSHYLELMTFENPEVINALPIDASKSDEARIAIERERKSQIKSKIKKARIRTGVLIEMSYKNYQGNSTKSRLDPKQAVKQGLAATGRVSQNIVPEQEAKDYARRLEVAIADLLRQLDYRYNPLYSGPFKGTDLPAQIDLIAFWRIQLNARNRGERTILLPIVTFAHSGEYPIKVCIPDPKVTSRWYTNLTAGQLAASEFEGGFDEENCRAFFSEAIKGLNIVRPTLLLLSDQNMRKIYPELGENQAREIRLSLGGILANKNIRVARLRLSAHDEAPFMVPNEGRSKYQGLYKHTDFPHVFASLHSLPNLQPGSEWSQVNNIGKQSRNVSNVQIALYNLADTDKPVEWAWLVHELRKESSHTDIPTQLPQPLYAGSKIKEYVFRAADEDELEADEEGN